MNTTIELDIATQKNVNQWLEGSYDAQTKASIREMLQKDPKKIIDAFFTRLSFGTAGLRGIMGIGSNRMNVYTVRGATQGLANYILKQHKPANGFSVFIGYDSRHHSREFAEETAKVLAGNGIKVYLYKDIRPTPLVSYGCRYKNCISAVMITASHNPPEYNGYKVYWFDGAQIVPPHDIGIISEVNRITDPDMVRMVPSIHSPLIEEIATDVDDAYIKDIHTLQNYPKDNKSRGNELNVVYTSLHGTGITLVPRALKDWGFNSISYVESQIIPDGSFPTANYPNPEEKEAMQMGVDLLLKTKGDILIATDPDADRMGVGVRNGDKVILLTGNQIVSICLAHICEALTKQKRLPEKAAFIKTIGTTELFQAICDEYKRPCFNVLTGFKYIGEKIHEWESLANGYQYIFGGEESYGYLIGSFVRDKDAVVCSALICEVALQAKMERKTLLDKLDELYFKFGVFEEKTIAINYGETKEGKEQMTSAMNRLRKTCLKEIAGYEVVAIEDYQTSSKYNLVTGETERLTLPVSDVLLYWLKDGSKVMVRPSGTEPKIKLSCGVRERTFKTIEEGVLSARKKCDVLLEALKMDLLRTV
jgi:phosphomannomutase